MDSRRAPNNPDSGTHSRVSAFVSSRMAHPSSNNGESAAIRSHRAQNLSDRELKAMKARVRVPSDSPLRDRSKDARTRSKQGLFDNTDAEDADETLSTMSGGVAHIQDHRADITRFGTDYNRHSLELMRKVNADHFHHMRGNVEAEGLEAYSRAPESLERQNDPAFDFWKSHAMQSCDDEEGDFMVEEALKRGRAALGAQRHQPQLSIDTTLSEPNPVHDVPNSNPVFSREDPSGSTARGFTSQNGHVRPDPSLSPRAHTMGRIAEESPRNDTMVATRNERQRSRGGPGPASFSFDHHLVSMSSNRHLADGRNGAPENRPSAYANNETGHDTNLAAEQVESLKPIAISGDNSRPIVTAFATVTPASSDDRPFIPFQNTAIHGQSLKGEDLPRPDYSPATLSGMNFADLQRQQFEHDPHAQPYLFPAENDNSETPLTFDAKMTFLLKRPTSERNSFFRSLSAEAWEDAGDWIVGNFSNIIKGLKSCRNQRRRISKEYELELARRHVRVQKKSRSIDRALEEMDSGTDYINKRLRKSYRGSTEPHREEIPSGRGSTNGCAAHIESRRPLINRSLPLRSSPPPGSVGSCGSSARPTSSRGHLDRK